MPNVAETHISSLNDSSTSLVQPHWFNPIGSTSLLQSPTLNCSAQKLSDSRKRSNLEFTQRILKTALMIWHL